MQLRLALSLALLALLAVPSAPAQDSWPGKPVKIVVPFGAAGSTDRMGRIVADELSKTFRQQFYVENRPGAGGALGAAQVARADADGYTLMIGGFGPHILGPAAGGKLDYDPLADFTHVAMIGGESYVLAAHAALGVKSLAELIARAKSEPVNCASPGVATLGQILVEQLRLRSGATQLNHVPYRGGGTLNTDLLGNHVSLAMLPVASMVAHARAGTVVLLASSASERLALLPDVPTFAELGYPEIGGSIWFWMAAPKNLPAPIVAKLSDEVRRIVATPQLRAQFEREALQAKDMGSAALNAFIADEIKRWSGIIAEAGLKK
jgi:tripartite-type tricarboxylate transporter receptor subunit TctC